jgi:hypothetical protein
MLVCVSNWHYLVHSCLCLACGLNFMNADASHGRAGRTNSAVASWLLFPLVTQKTRVQLLTAEVLLTLALGFCSGVGGCLIWVLVLLMLAF